MSVVAIHDFDFFRYENVIPNLECAKLVAYYRNHRDITVLTPALNPEKYTKFIVRKEYDDGIYPREFFLPNCEYGGRAFNPEKYKPLAPEIEATVPDMHIYDNFINHFGKKKSELTQIKRILNCAHMRLAPDSQNLLSFETLNKQIDKHTTGIFLHDFDLASLHPYDLIKALQDQRHFVTREGINPYPVGNKYPIRIYSPDELARWYSIVTIPNCFFLEYYGLMTDEVLYNLCLENRRMARQIYYDVAYGCSSENQFLIERAPKILIQALFLKKAGVRILLTYDEKFLVTKELQNFIKLLNYMIAFQWQEGFLPRKQTLFTLCRDHSRLQYTNWAFQTIKLSVEDNRAMFQYMRENNYELFKLFYEWDAVIFKGGRFVNEWTRNSLED